MNALAHTQKARADRTGVIFEAKSLRLIRKYHLNHKWRAGTSVKTQCVWSREAFVARLVLKQHEMQLEFQDEYNETELA